MALRLIGGWGNRSDDLRSCVERLRRSMELIPSEPEVYGGWGVWRPQDPPSKYRDLVPLDLNDDGAVSNAIVAVTERINGAPRTVPGLDIELARHRVDHATPSERQVFEYLLRVGFVGYPNPFNHVLLEVEEVTDESVLTRYLSALVVAWEPDALAVVDPKTQRAQRVRGYGRPQPVIGWLTYLRAGTPFDTAALDDRISVVNADGGVYVGVPGTPGDPSLEHVRQVRTALGYPNPE